MCGSSESNHSFQYEKPRFLVEYFEQTISERFIIIVVVILDECLQILIVFVSTEGVFYLKQKRVARNDEREKSNSLERSTVPAICRHEYFLRLLLVVLKSQSM